MQADHSVFLQGFSWLDSSELNPYLVSAETPALLLRDSGAQDRRWC